MFVDEQGVSLEEDRDGRDGEALHLVAVDDAAGDRHLPAARRGHDAEARAPGGRRPRAAPRHRAAPARAGRREAARAPEPSAIALDAQTYALALYERAGYARARGRFVDEGIEHVWMEKRHA